MNGTGDFDAELLDAIYRNIHKNEIVMPSEQTGLVRENYLWKVSTGIARVELSCLYMIVRSLA